MKVKDVMSRNVECITPESNIMDAAVKMRELNVGMLPVCGAGEKLVGMVTDRDITIRAVADGQNPSTARVKDIMTPDVIYCYDDVDAKEAAELMKEKQIRRLVVLDRSGRLVGVLHRRHGIRRHERRVVPGLHCVAAAVTLLARGVHPVGVHGGRPAGGEGTAEDDGPGDRVIGRRIVVGSAEGAA